MLDERPKGRPHRPEEDPGSACVTRRGGIAVTERPFVALRALCRLAPMVRRGAMACGLPLLVPLFAACAPAGPRAPEWLPVARHGKPARDADIGSSKQRVTERGDVPCPVGGRLAGTWQQAEGAGASQPSPGPVQRSNGNCFIASALGCPVGSSARAHPGDCREQSLSHGVRSADTRRPCGGRPARELVTSCHEQQRDGPHPS